MSSPTAPPPTRRRRGFVTVLVALSLIVILGIVALVLDSGALMEERRQAQAVADAAALAGATELFKSYRTQGGVDSDGNASASAFAVAAQNGYTNDTVNTVVEVHIPPQSGDHVGQAGYVEVTARSNETRFFSGVFGSGRIPISARAVARGTFGPMLPAILVLDMSRRAALDSHGQGSARVTLPTGSPTGAGAIIVNSDHFAAAANASGSNARLVSEGGFFITGDISGTQGDVESGMQFQGPVFTGVPRTPDPLIDLPVPGLPSTGTINRTDLGKGNFQYDLYPGAFSNLPNFNAGDVVVFHQTSSNSNGGIYYLSRGGLNSQGATLQMAAGESGGMMLYNAATRTNDKITIVGGTSGSMKQLAPLTEGPYKGLCIFQNRSSSVPLRIAGNGQFDFTGAIYAPAAPVSIEGNGDASMASAFICGTLDIGGNGSLNVNWRPDAVPPIRRLMLVE